MLLPLLHILPPANFASDLESSVTSLVEDHGKSLSLNDSNVDIESDLDNSSEDVNTDRRMRTVYCVAKKVVKILRDLNMECAVFGSAACSLYGNTRSPNVCCYSSR